MSEPAFRSLVIPARDFCYATDPDHGVLKIPGQDLYCGCSKCLKRQGIKKVEKVDDASPLEKEVRKAIQKVVNHVRI